MTFLLYVVPSPKEDGKAEGAATELAKSIGRHLARCGFEQLQHVLATGDLAEVPLSEELIQIQRRDEPCPIGRSAHNHKADGGGSEGDNEGSNLR